MHRPHYAINSSMVSFKDLQWPNELIDVDFSKNYIKLQLQQPNRHLMLDFHEA
jgi:hypothetical protein